MQRLIAELLTDPLQLGYDRKDIEGTTAKLNVPRSTRSLPISAEQFIRWLSMASRYR